MAARNTLKEFFFSAKKQQETAFNSRLAPRESLLKVWNVDKHDECVKISKSKSKHPKLRTYHLTEWTILGQDKTWCVVALLVCLSAPFFFGDSVCLHTVSLRLLAL